MKRFLIKLAWRLLWRKIHRPVTIGALILLLVTSLHLARRHRMW